MARRKLFLVFLLLGTMILILSPWADAPSPHNSYIAVPQVEALTEPEPATSEEISYLVVQAAVDELEFHALAILNEQLMRRHPEIVVQLSRIDPELAYSTFKQAFELEEAADILLMSNEWVKKFASSGYLLPVDSAFMGKALAEQFDALAAPLKWNGYIWGVPRDMDPFVLVWNRDILQARLGPDIQLPLTPAQWDELIDSAERVPEETEEMEGVEEAGGERAEEPIEAAWVAIHPEDPLALLAWLEYAVQERSDGLWSEEVGEVWTGTAFEDALSLLERGRADVYFAAAYDQAAKAVADGIAVAAVIPNSVATVLIDSLDEERQSHIELDRQAWKLPYIWPRGSSFVMSTHTKALEAAYTWMSEMTDEQAQLDNLEKFRLLPVYRSIYDSDWTLSKLIPDWNGEAFPNEAPLFAGPEIVGDIQRLGRLWTGLAAGELTVEEWKEQWASPSR